KARSAQNAIKHGLRAIRHCVLPQEDPGAFDALQYAMFAELQPAGVMEVLLARRVAVAAWRLARADRMEAEALAFRSYEDADAGLALMRDCNGARAIDTLIRYRNGAFAEFTRALRALQALQAVHAAEDAEAEADAAAEAEAAAPDHEPTPALPTPALPTPGRASPTRSAAPHAPHAPHRPAAPNEPEPKTARTA